MPTRKPCALLILVLHAAAVHAQVTLTADTAVLIDPQEPGPIQKAARDLASDMSSVFGRPVRLVDELSSASPNTICIAFSRNLPEAVQRPAGREVLKLQALRNPWPGSKVRQAIFLTGSDVRGVIYAIYEFSQRFLNVDPFYWWTDNPPARRTSVVIPEVFSDQQGPPTFRYRGWFMNDEDLLTSWRPGTQDRTGISLEVWDRIFEAILRLKGNMIVPNTFVFPYEPQVRAAGDRGLAIAQHHMEPLGLNVYQWPPDQPYTLDRLAAAWKCAVSQYPKDIEVVWTVGLRGRYDRPFWRDIPNGPATPEGRARLIREAIDKQIEIVRRGWPHPNPKFILNSWMEGSALMRSGQLQVPPGVNLVWADDGGGLLQDGGLIGAGQGVYYHTGVLGGNANNFTEQVPVPRIQRELGRAARAGATEYLLLNPSNVRPVVMGTRAVMDIAWDAKPWLSKDCDYSSVWLAAWCREEFSPKAAPLIEQYYRAYFAAPARFGEKENAAMADDFYHQLGRDLLVRIMRDDVQPPARFRNPAAPSYAEYTSRVVSMCKEAEPRWGQAARLAAQAGALVPPNRRDFFQAHVLTQLGVHVHSNRMLRNIAEAASLGTSPSVRLERMDEAIREIQALLAALRAAEYGQWAGFYTVGDWFVDIPLTLHLAKACRTKLEGRSLSPVERTVLESAERHLREDTSSVYIRIKAYQIGQRVQFCEE